MKIAIAMPRPRNPFVVAAKFRRAGVHRNPGACQRQDAAHALRRALNEMKHIP